MDEEYKYEKIKFISGRNWSNSYYTDCNGKLYSGSTGSNYIKYFIENINLDVEFVEYHPNLLYFYDGVSMNVQDLYPYHFENFKDIPKWTYSKDRNKPLIPQLDETELFEFFKFNFSGKYTKKY